jgi:hypothetical protein
VTNDADPKVVTIWGGYRLPPGEAVPEVVAQLEELLERARSGVIVGMIVVAADPERDACVYTSGLTHGFAVIGALHCAITRAAHDANQNFDDVDPG